MTWIVSIRSVRNAAVLFFIFTSPTLSIIISTYMAAKCQCICIDSRRRKHMKKTKETKTKDDHILSREDRIRESQEFNLLSDVFLSVALDDAPACQHIIRKESVITAHWQTVNSWQRERNTMNCRTGCSFTSARQTSGNRERQSTR